MAERCVPGILGRKVGMTQIYDEAGNVMPVTVVQAGPCHVLQVRTKERDGYEAVQLGFLDKPRRLASRSERGHVAKLDSKRSKKLADGRRRSCSTRPTASRKRFIREFRGPAGDLEVGGKVDVDVLEGVKAVDVTGITQGPRLLGRHEAAQLQRPAGHARREEVHRPWAAPAAARFPAGVMKGKKMAGQYGNERMHDPQSEARADRRGEQPAADPRRGAGPERRLCDRLSETNKV